MSFFKGFSRVNVNLKMKLSDRNLAGYVVRKLVKSVMNAEQFECFALSRTESCDNIMAHVFSKGLPSLSHLTEDGEFKDTRVRY